MKHSIRGWLPAFLKTDSWFSDEESKKKYGRLVRINPSRIKKIESMTHDLFDSGCFASVYTLIDGKVLKVSRNEDFAYQAFLRMALTRQNNPFYPRVFAAGFFKNKQIVVLEKLNELSFSEHELENSLRALRSSLKSCDQKWLKAAYRRLRTQPSARKAIKSHLSEFRQLVRDLKTLSGTYSYDLHPANLMVRDNGQLVVTDPIA